MDLFRVAVVQAGSVPFNRERSTTKALDLTDQAIRSGARLIVFPEAFISGYPKGIDFGARVGMRSQQGREWFRTYFESSITVPGSEVDQLTSAARDGGVYLVIGVIERDGGALYCTALFFGPDGLLGKHRKLMPTAMERLIWGFGDGATLPVFDTPAGKMGAVICWENYMPLLRAAMYAKGIQICFVLSACQYIRRGDYPADYPAIQGDDPQTVLIRGGSVIVSPLGCVLAGPDYSGEKILTADLDPGEIAEGKFDLDVVGHYARPDVFRLEVNEKAGF